MAEQVKLDQLVEVLKTYRDYVVEVRKLPKDIFGENYDDVLNNALSKNDYAVINSGINSIAQSARSIAGTPESERFFSYCRSRLGRDLFEVISSPDAEAKKILKKGEVRSHEEARIIEAYVELYEGNPEDEPRIDAAKRLLEFFDRTESSEK